MEYQKKGKRGFRIDCEGLWIEGCASRKLAKPRVTRATRSGFASSLTTRLHLRNTRVSAMTMRPVDGREGVCVSHRAVPVSHRRRIRRRISRVLKRVRRRGGKLLRRSRKAQETHVVGAVIREIGTGWTERRHWLHLIILRHFWLWWRWRRRLSRSGQFLPSQVEEDPDRKYDKRHNTSHDAYTQSTTELDPSIIKEAPNKGRNRSYHRQWHQF